MEMEYCECVEPNWQAGDLLMKYQYISDLFIACAYFSIPFELIYFVKKTSFFPYKWPLIQFGALVVLCGTTHLLNLWSPYTKTLEVVMTVTKFLAAGVSCITVLMFVDIIPELLSVKIRELFLKKKTEELDREMSIIRIREASGKKLRMLTQEIRSSLDKTTILNTTLVELGKTLDLEECAYWAPSTKGFNLHLLHTLNRQIPLGSTITITLPVVDQVLKNNRAVKIPHTSPLAKDKPATGKYAPPEVVAIRVPLLNIPNVQIKDWQELPAKGYAIMVLMLPLNSARKWRSHELELVQLVAYQVAVALSHAVVLEDVTGSRDGLRIQNYVLDSARQKAEMAKQKAEMAKQQAEMVICSRNDFLAVMKNEIRTPMHAIMSTSSLLLESELAPEHRSMVETMLISSNLVMTLASDVLDVFKMEAVNLELELEVLNLHDVFKQVMNMIMAIAAMKKLSVSVIFAPDLPMWAIGDEKRLFQIILNIVGNAVKFTKEGFVEITASFDSLRDPRPTLSAIHQVTSYERFFYLQVQVKDTGCGIKPQDIPRVFTKFAQRQNFANKGYNGGGIGLAICKRFISLMDGDIWIESEGIEKGCTVLFIVKLGKCNNPKGNPTKRATDGVGNFSDKKVLNLDAKGKGQIPTDAIGKKSDKKVVLLDEKGKGQVSTGGVENISDKKVMVLDEKGKGQVPTYRVRAISDKMVLVSDKKGKGQLPPQALCHQRSA